MYIIIKCVYLVYGNYTKFLVYYYDDDSNDLCVHFQQHNLYCHLDLPKKKTHKVFTSMIKGLKQTLVVHAITANPAIHR